MIEALIIVGIVVVLMGGGPTRTRLTGDPDEDF